MSIANRLIAGFGVVIALIVALGLYSLSQVGRVRDTTERLVSRDLTMIRQLGVISDGQNEMRATREAALRTMFTRTATPRSLEEAQIVWRRHLATTSTAIDEATSLAGEYNATALSAERAETWRRVGGLLTQVDGELGALQVSADEQFAALRRGDVAGALEVETQLSQRREAMAALVLAEAVLEKFGGDSVSETRRNFLSYMENLRFK